MADSLAILPAREDQKPWVRHLQYVEPCPEGSEHDWVEGEAWCYTPVEIYRKCKKCGLRQHYVPGYWTNTLV